jgi:hypothetical protein
MAIVIISENLRTEIIKKFKKEAEKIFELMYSLRENPQKGKEIGYVNKALIKEIRYNGYRFYFVTDGYRLKFLELRELDNLLFKFVRMSDKKSQQKVIGEIKKILKTLGTNGF